MSQIDIRVLYVDVWLKETFSISLLLSFQLFVWSEYVLNSLTVVPILKKDSPHTYRMGSL